MLGRLCNLSTLPWLLNLVLCYLIVSKPFQAAPRRPVPLASPPAPDCSIGTAPGSWFSGNAPGSRWQPLGPDCQLNNLLDSYRNNADAPPLKVLALSDSVDRFLFNFTCTYLQGTYTSAQPPNDDPSLNITAYLLHSCSGLTSPLKLASTYIPGIHPTGPFHNRIIQGYPARIEYAKLKWIDYAGGPPDIVVIASNLWDVARISGHEPELLQQGDFSAATLQQWMANFTAVVKHVQQAFPEAKAYVYHTTMAPRLNARTGEAVKPYLGHRNHVAQLNAAGVAAARALGMQVVDYVPVAARLSDGQAYLHDLIHPRQDVCLELANIYFNIGARVLAADSSS